MVLNMLFWMGERLTRESAAVTVGAGAGADEDEDEDAAEGVVIGAKPFETAT